MISVSQEVIDLINADSRTFRAKFKHGDSVYDKIMSLKWNVCLPSSSFSVGNALSIGIQCTAFDVPVSIKGEELELVITIEGSADEISIGSFTAEKPTIQNGIVSFNAYDDMSKAGNIPYNSTLGEGKHTVNQYVADVAETLGIGYISLGSEGEVTVENDYLSGNSCRNALAYLAGYLGRNCVIKNKKISMKKFTLVDYTMNADRIEEPELEDIDSEIDFIIAQISSNNTIMNGNGATGTELVCPIMTESQLSNVANMLFGDASPVKTYRSGKVKLLLGDPRLELCDVIKLDYKDAEYIIPITSISFEYDGGLMTDIEAYALKEPTLLTPSQRLDFAVQEEVKKVLEQLKNIDGTYFYIRYSPNADGSNMTEEPDDKTEYIGVCSTNQSSAPGEASAYTWSKFKGKDGSSNFFHVKYSNDGGKTFTGTDGETAGEYIGILVDSNEDESTNPSDYTWSKIVGTNGKGISAVINYYLTTNKMGGVTRDDFGGNTEIVTPDKDKPYLWNYEEIRYTSGNPTYTDPCIIGNFAENGSNGRGIKSITEYYLTTQTESTPSKSSFKDTVQTPTETFPFLWNYEKIEYTDESTPYESDVRLIGVYGSDGKSLFTWVKYADDASGTNMSDNATGKKYMGIAYNKTSATESTTASDYAWSKIQGDDGRGVSKVVTEYYLSTSETTQIGGSWSEDAPEWVDEKYLWTRLATTYTDGKTEYSDPVVDASWKKTSVVDEASKELNETLANALGLHVTEYAVGSSRIRYYHSNSSLTSSKSGDTILVFNSNGFGVCKTGWNNGNPQFTYGATFDGKAVWDILTANTINADLIKAGSIKSLPSAKVQTTINLDDGTYTSTAGDTKITIQGGEVDEESGAETTPAGILLDNLSDGSTIRFSVSGIQFMSQEYLKAYTAYAIALAIDIALGTNNAPALKPEDPYFSSVAEKDIKTTNLHCKNIYIVGDSDGNEYNLMDALSMLSEQVNLLSESLTTLQEKYLALEEALGQQHEHTASTAVRENVVPATCTTQGSYDEVVYCATCPEEISRTKKYTNKLDHSYTSAITKQPTCIETGIRTHTCTRCGDSYTEVISATGEHIDSDGNGCCDVCGTKTGEFYTLTLNVEPSGGGTVEGAGSYLSGSAATVKAAHANGYTFEGWYQGTTKLSGNATYSVPMTASKTLTAKFTKNPTSYTISLTASPTGGGYFKIGGVKTNSSSLTEGSTVTIEAIPNDGYTFKKWSDGSTSASRTVTVNSAIAYTATFEAVETEQTISEGVETSVNLPVQKEVVYLKFVPKYSGSYTFVSLDQSSLDPDGYIYLADKQSQKDSDTSSGGFSVSWDGFVAGTTYYLAARLWSGTGTLKVKVTKDAVVQNYTITTAASPSSYGSITGGGTYASGATATLTATPNSGYRFTKWQDGNTDNPRSVTVTGNATYTATFEAVTANTEDTIATGQTKTVTVGNSNASGLSGLSASNFSLLKFTPTVTAEYSFRATGYTGSSSDTCGCLFNSSKSTMLASNDNIGDSSHFSIRYNCTAGTTYYLGVKFYDANVGGTITVKCDTETKYTLTVQASSSEGGTVSGGGTVKAGEYCSFTATANDGYEFAGWYDGNTLVTTSASSQIAMTANKTLTAKFSKILADGQYMFVITKTAGTPTATVKVKRNGEDITVADDWRDTYAFNEGDTFELTVTPESNRSFSWHFDKRNMTSSVNPFTFTATASDNGGRITLYG